MARIKAKARPVIVAANDPTPERMCHSVFVQIDAPRMADEEEARDRVGSRTRPQLRKRVDPIKRMEGGTDPWINRIGAHSLEQYSKLIEQAGYDAGSRGCLSTSHGGGGPENLYDIKLAARTRFARAASAIGKADLVALLFINAVLSPVDEKTVGDLTKDLLGGRMGEAREKVGIAATALTEHFARR